MWSPKAWSWHRCTMYDCMIVPNTPTAPTPSFWRVALHFARFWRQKLQASSKALPKLRSQWLSHIFVARLVRPVRRCTIKRVSAQACLNSDRHVRDAANDVRNVIAKRPVHDVFKTARATCVPQNGWTDTTHLFTGNTLESRRQSSLGNLLHWAIHPRPGCNQLSKAPRRAHDCQFR